MDGARIFNAAVALGESVAQMTRNLDSVMFCLSKGLGAPVGSMIVGSREFIDKARICRKMFGGGMRQAGVLAATGLIALGESPKRLHEDHANARYLATEIAKIPGLRIDAATVKTNIVIFDCEQNGMNAVQLCQALQSQDIWALDTAPYSVRFVTHCDVDRAGCERAIRVLEQVQQKSNRRSA